MICRRRIATRFRFGRSDTVAWYEAGALLIGLILAFMALGLPVAFAFFAANLIGVTVFMGGWQGMLQLVDNATSLISTFTLIALPMFVLMGSLFFHTGLAFRMFDALDALLGRLPARLCYLTVAGGATFSTLVGSSMANTAMLGSLLVPEMLRRGYKKHMAMGPVLGSGGLAMIIPPSGLAVLLGSIARVDVGALLIAGLLPGFVLAGLYALAVLLLSRFDPDAAPAYDVSRVPLAKKIRLIATHILPMGLVIFCVVGFILLGITTPSEAAAFGVLSIGVLAALFRRLTIAAVRESLVSAIKVSGMAFLIIVGSSAFSQILSFSGASTGLLEWTGGLKIAPIYLLLAMFAVILVLGMFMDGVSIMLLTVPIFFPIAKTLGFDLVWFGLIVLMGLEMSQTTPPFGLLLYIMMGVAPRGTTLREVVIAAAPYLVCDAVLVALLIVFPALALYLPRVMS